jgi:hypothetical protein
MEAIEFANRCPGNVKQLEKVKRLEYRPVITKLKELNLAQTA